MAQCNHIALKSRRVSERDKAEEEVRGKKESKKENDPATAAVFEDGRTKP